MTEFCVVLVTAEHVNQAEMIAEKLVQERLAACINIVDNVRSVFMWESHLNQSAEVMLVVKTKTALFNQLEARILELHSYDVPEVIALPIIAGSKQYLKWLDQQSTSKVKT